MITSISTTQAQYNHFVYIIINKLPMNSNIILLSCRFECSPQNPYNFFNSSAFISFALNFFHFLVHNFFFSSLDNVLILTFRSMTFLHCFVFYAPLENSAHVMYKFAQILIHNRSGIWSRALWLAHELFIILFFEPCSKSLIWYSLLSRCLHFVYVVR